VTQAVQHLLCNHEAEFKPSPTNKKKGIYFPQFWRLRSPISRCQHLARAIRLCHSTAFSEKVREDKSKNSNSQPHALVISMNPFQMAELS
jgi:hypothetical protein